MDFSHIPQSFAALGSAFYARLDAQPLAAAHSVAHSQAMARELGLSDEWMQSNEALAVLTGNARAKGSQPLASVYSGHQFGVWAGQLGDGRALLLGELSSPDGKPWDIQLKGAGPTPYSRMGDGRAVLRSSIREFLCSEAMHGLGIPTTRALAVTGSPQPVRREDIETAAVVTRCAPSFIRFGHFEHFSYLGQHAQLKALADHVIQRFYTECQEAKNPYAALLEAVSARTAQLIAQWQAVGFCHGVMNTDNMSILGLTIDYGPFQFLDTFNPAHICNHSDGHGRYAYDKQPNVAYWNLFCLGQALMPLIRAIESHDDAAQEAALGALEPYKSIFPNTLQARMAAKLGFAQAHEGQRELIESILKLLAADHVDYTIFWRRLSHARALGDDSAVRDLFVNRQACDDWLLLLNEHSRIIPCGQDSHLMLKSNPAYVLRNHLGELAIRAAKQHDFSEVKRLHRVLENPYAEQPGMDSYASFAPDWATSLEISCSS